MSPSSDFLTDLFGKPSSGGQISLNRTRPTVVTMTFLSALPKTVGLPKSEFARRIRSCVFNAPSSQAKITSSFEPNNGRVLGSAGIGRRGRAGGERKQAR